MKKRLIDAGILAAVFIAAVIGFSFWTNRGNDNMTADIGNAALPSVSFSCEGYGVNPLNGYTQEMDVTTMRDTITPVVNQQLQMNIAAYDNKISAVTYQLYSIDGKEKLYENTIEEAGEKVTLSFEEGLLTEERVLVVDLKVEGELIHYYSRVRDAAGVSAKECLDYIYNYHENALAKVEGAGVGAALEPSDEADNKSFWHVTIHSDYDHVTWGELEPKIEGPERWKIVESNPTFTSVQLEYELRCKGEENAEDLYTVKEFFRVRHASGTMYLLNYDRTMSQIFDGTKNVLSEKGILLGITNYNVPYMVNNDGTVVSFIQANELWNYSKDTDQMSLLFSFRDAENTDERNLVSDHEIKLLAMDKSGNTTFAVYGYMNRGAHEGEVGAAIYYYNIEKNSIDEKVFIPSNKSAAIAAEELGKLVYYSIERDMLYVLVDGTLHEIAMDKEEKSKLVEKLEDGQYVVSEDGHLVAYQADGTLYEAKEVVVKNLKTGKEYKVAAGEGETIKPLGFINNDFISGTSKTADVGKTISGETVIPMYKVDIRNTKSDIIKTYESGTDYVLDTQIEDGMLTLNRAVKNGDVYTSISADYITNNEEKEESNISLESYATDLKETQMRLTFADGIQDKEAKLLKPKQVLFEQPAVAAFGNEPITGRYYVYGNGELQGIYRKAGYAVQKADEVSGVVVSSDQEYVWERGNRYLKYAITGKDDIIAVMREQLSAGKPAIQTADDLSGGKSLDLTGCTTEEMLYVVNKGTPVIGMIDSSSSVILVGYDETYVTYIETATGNQTAVPYEQMDAMLAGTGRAFIGYIE